MWFVWFSGKFSLMLFSSLLLRRIMVIWTYFNKMELYIDIWSTMRNLRSEILSAYGRSWHKHCFNLFFPLFFSCHLQVCKIPWLILIWFYTKKSMTTVSFQATFLKKTSYIYSIIIDQFLHFQSWACKYFPRKLFPNLIFNFSEKETTENFQVFFWLSYLKTILKGTWYWTDDFKNNSYRHQDVISPFYYLCD